LCVNDGPFSFAVTLLSDGARSPVDVISDQERLLVAFRNRQRPIASTLTRIRSLPTSPTTRILTNPFPFLFLYLLS
jgi:hypothetical protein